MEELDKIFIKIEKKKNIIFEFSKKFEELSQNHNLTKKETSQKSKNLYKMFIKEMKSIDKHFN